MAHRKFMDIVKDVHAEGLYGALAKYSFDEGKAEIKKSFWPQMSLHVALYTYSTVFITSKQKLKRELLVVKTILTAL